MIKVRREDAIMSEDPPTDALEGVEVRKRIYTEQIVSEDRTPHDKERALSNDYLAPLDLNNYHTDKITNGYMNVYGPILAPLRSKPIKLLELGVLGGESLRLWQDYFWNGTIVGLDLRPVTINGPMERIFVYQGAQQDTALLSRIAQERASDGFDIIIDDASHIADLTRISFWHLFDNHLKPGGLYVVEDWGTGYWSDWPDGMTYRQHPFFRERILSLLKFIRASRRIPSYSHSFGMVGFIKELVDEMGAHDLTRGLLTGKPKRQSKFRQVLVVPSMVFITKSDSPQSGFRDSVACG